jgi:hypothetical protein
MEQTAYGLVHQFFQAHLRGVELLIHPIPKEPIHQIHPSLKQLEQLERRGLLQQPPNPLRYLAHVDVPGLVGPSSLRLSVLLVDCRKQMLSQTQMLRHPRLAVWQRSRLLTLGLHGLDQDHFVEGKSTDPNSLGEGQLRWNHAAHGRFRRWLR